MTKPTLYIIARKDIPDLNPGKLAAQVAHAQAEFDAYIEEKHIDGDFHSTLLSGYREWCGEKKFGRTIVLQGTLAEMKDLVRAAGPSMVTVDPTYPWRNYYGDVIVSEEPTCAWIFVYKENQFALERLKELPLHP